MIGVVSDQLEIALKARNHIKTVPLIEKKIALLEKEDIATPRFLYRLEYQAYLACKLQGLHERARAWLLKANTHSLMSDDKGAEDVAEDLAQPLTAILSYSPADV